MDFKVDLDVFSGPLDLLLYLVRKHEVDVRAVPIARITAEFVACLDVLSELAIDRVGDFVDLATVLLEIKARALVPRPEETEEAVDPVREDLVQRLLEYRQYRDAAAMLEDRARLWESRSPRAAPAHDPAAEVPAGVVIGDAQVWDLVGAMARVLRKREQRRPRQILHDDTPLEVHVGRIEAAVAEQGRVAFTALFTAEMPRARVVGIFLAVLELIRRGRLATRQEEMFGEIWLEPRTRSPQPRLEPA